MGIHAPEIMILQNDSYVETLCLWISLVGAFL